MLHKLRKYSFFSENKKKIKIRKRKTTTFPTYLFIYEMINFLQWPSVHVLRKWFKFLWQDIAIFHGGLVARMKAIFTNQLDVTSLIFDFRFLGVGNNLLFGNCNGKTDNEKWGVRKEDDIKI